MLSRKIMYNVYCMILFCFIFGQEMVPLFNHWQREKLFHKIINHAFYFFKISEANALTKKMKLKKTTKYLIHLAPPSMLFFTCHGKNVLGNLSDSHNIQPDKYWQWLLLTNIKFVTAKLEKSRQCKSLSFSQAATPKTVKLYWCIIIISEDTN